MTQQPPPHDPVPSSPPPAEHRSLRGTFIAVLCMAVFFVAAWLSMYALVLERR